jgi:hypothetical protein
LGSWERGPLRVNTPFVISARSDTEDIGNTYQ